LVKVFGGFWWWFLVFGQPRFLAGQPALTKSAFIIFFSFLINNHFGVF